MESNNVKKNQLLAEIFLTPIYLFERNHRISAMIFVDQN